MKNLIFGLIALFSVVLFSCEKETTSFSNEDEAIIANDAAADAVIGIADDEVDLFSGSNESITYAGSSLKSYGDGFFGGRYRFGHCPNITVEYTDGGFPVTITLNYGDSTVLANGIVISGSIVITISAPPRTNGTVRTVTFNDFYIDSVNIAGTRTMTFSVASEGEITNNIEGSIVITFPDGTYIERETEKTRTFSEGYDTPYDYSDDVFTITGFTNSVSSEGFTFSTTIIEPLIKKATCRFIVQGVVQIAKNDIIIAELNYGDGTCDDIATITKDGVTKQITLGKRHRIRNNQ